MEYQLGKVVAEIVAGTKKMLDIHTSLERLFRRSFMASEFNLRYPDLALDVDNHVEVMYLPMARNSGSWVIQKEGHPLKGLVYSSASPEYLKTNVLEKGTWNGTFGYFSDPEELVLQYVRKDLF